MTEEIIKLKPIYKEFLWGGTKIRDVLKKNFENFECVAESWELSTHPEGQSIICSGKYNGRTLKEYFDIIGWDTLGRYAKKKHQLPVMVKFIDACQNLSIQVHPTEYYARKLENDSGKNEMWYIVDADEDAFIYLGFIKNVAKKEILLRSKNGTIEEILNKIPVKKGQSYYIPAGTVHAIGAGCLICEVQQTSNITYRLYDYGRKGANGKPRDLQIKKALRVVNTRKTEIYFNKKLELFSAGSQEGKVLTKNSHFKVIRYDVNGMFSTLSIDENKALVVVEGSGKMYSGDEAIPISIGDTFFLQNAHNIKILGKCVVLMVII